MTYTYSLADNIGKVRLLISDNVEAAAQFTDEEITYFLTESGNTVNLAAAIALEAWAASYSANVDSEKIGDYSYSQKIIDKMLTLAKRLRDAVAEAPTLTWAEMDLTGEDEA